MRGVAGVLDGLLWDMLCEVVRAENIKRAKHRSPLYFVEVMAKRAHSFVYISVRVSNRRDDQAE